VSLKNPLFKHLFATEKYRVTLKQGALVDKQYLADGSRPFAD
jgi:hypothetical protein